MDKSVSLLLLTLATVLGAVLNYHGNLELVFDYLTSFHLDSVLSVLVIYLFLYWIVVEVKNSYLEWKYLEEA